MGMTTYVAVMMSTSPSVQNTQTPKGGIVCRLPAGLGVCEGNWGAMLAIGIRQPWFDLNGIGLFSCASLAFTVYMVFEGHAGGHFGNIGN